MVNWTSAYLGARRGQRKNPTPITDAIIDAIKELRNRDFAKRGNHAGGEQVSEHALKHVVPDMQVEYRRPR